MIAATARNMRKECGTPNVRPAVGHSRVGKLWPNSKPAVSSLV